MVGLSGRLSLQQKDGQGLVGGGVRAARAHKVG